MRIARPTFALAVLGVVLAGSDVSAIASPTTVGVRVEGKTQTLFEGPIRTDGRAVQASSDTQARLCDGTNGGAHATPGPTPIASTVDAMSLAGLTFDGTWTAGLNDYFITRWGPDKQSAAENEYWGLLVNQTLTAKGGCQYQLATADQVLWVYDAFAGRPLLTLAAAEDSATPPSPTAIAKLAQPFAVEVRSFTSTEGTHHDLGPFEGAQVAPVSTDANGFQSLETGSPSTVTTAPDGTATITFDAPGWHRLKATANEAIRSNRLDVCVPAQGASDCGALPADDQVRGLGSDEPPEEPPHEPPPNPEPKSETSPGAPPGSIVAGGAPGGTSVLGNSASRQSRQLRLNGLLLTPIDDRAGGLDFGGHWRTTSEPQAWLKTLSFGARNAMLTFRLAAGRPVLIVRAVHRQAKLAIVVGKRRQIVTIAGSRTEASRLVIGARRTHPGTVHIRVLKGTVGIDGVALTP
jgi:hypothetical protein